MSIDFGQAFLYTFLMTIISTILAYIVGLPLGIILTITSKDGIKPNRYLNIILGLIVNILRSIPCLILTVILIPLNRNLFGKGTGEWYTMIIPLFFSCFAYVSRIVEQSLKEVNKGSIEAVKAMGGNSFDIIYHVLLVEARSSLILGVSVTLVNVIGYTSFAYNLGAGGLISEVWKYYSTHTASFLTSSSFYILIILVVILVQVIQELGLFISRKLDKRLKNDPSFIRDLFKKKEKIKNEK